MSAQLPGLGHPLSRSASPSPASLPPNCSVLPTRPQPTVGHLSGAFPGTPATYTDWEREAGCDKEASGLCPGPHRPSSLQLSRRGMPGPGGGPSPLCSRNSLSGCPSLPPSDTCHLLQQTARFSVRSPFWSGSIWPGLLWHGISFCFSLWLLLQRKRNEGKKEGRGNRGRYGAQATQGPFPSIFSGNGLHPIFLAAHRLGRSEAPSFALRLGPAASGEGEMFFGGPGWPPAHSLCCVTWGLDVGTGARIGRRPWTPSGSTGLEASGCEPLQL